MFDDSDFDPNTWSCWTPELRRVWGDDREHIHALVDEIDYQWAIQWRWSPKISRGGKKIYLFRPTSIPGINDQNVRQSIYLHVAICERAYPTKPSPLHTIGDHRNGNGLDCQRHNLRWATPSMNRRNINGEYSHDLIEG